MPDPEHEQDPETTSPERGNPVRGVDAPPTVAPNHPEPAPSIVADGPVVDPPVGATTTFGDTPDDGPASGQPGQAAAGTTAAVALGGTNLDQAEPGAAAVDGTAADQTAPALPADHPETARNVGALVEKEIG